MKEELFKFLLDQVFLFDFFINNILYKLFLKEKPEFYIKYISKNNFLQKLYLIKDFFHKQLKNHDEIFYLNQEYIKSEFSDYFYLSLLISDEPDIIHYNYNYNLIISISDKNECSENLLKKVMTSKIIIDLINNFKNVKSYKKEEYEKKLNEIIDKNEKIIKENLYKFKELNINLSFDDIINMKIDDIYIKVIESKMESDKFEESKKIFLQLGLDVINLSNIKIKKLEKKVKYIISEVQDLFDKEKINYYYILVKYIFNTNSSINNINLLKNFQQFLIKIIKSQLYELYFYYIDNETINEKRNYIVKFILNNDYYYQKYLEIIKLISYYKKYLSEPKKAEIKSNEIIFKNNKLNKKHEIDSNFKIIKYLFKKYKFKVKEAIEKWIEIKKLIDNKKTKELKKYDDLLINYRRNEFSKELFIKIFSKDTLDYLDEEFSNIKTIVNIKILMIIMKEYKILIITMKIMEIQIKTIALIN